jgi:class 3 adenylate cyclase/tetratricopeptide (TPR) repeat protein
VVICPSCGTENPVGAKFCNQCATSLGAPARRPIEEERKVITSLVCDLIGFTATSEFADPEDVDRMLSAYAAMARAQIEGHGGVVEKFIGDAVVGIFGVPAAHEDDPERAVRAGLRIAEGAKELEAVGGAPLRLRVGINTGEALVHLGIAPGAGERLLAGDVINTASRIQSVAPEMGVAVGLATYEPTAAVFDYEELEPAMLKGKAERVRVFHARALRARFGTDLTRTRDTPFIGREIELALLRGIFDKAVAANSVQLVTVVGEPGIGKSRIVAELLAQVDAGADLVNWHQGRCPPYGEGITFWALGEIVKAHAGILESDPPGVAQAKLDVVLPEGPERAWFRQRLLPLLGIEASSSAEREELFTAWRRFVEQISVDQPTVLVFEDLHWSDEAMLVFLEYLADRAEGVALLVVGTARPELYERHPDYTAGLPNANTINLAPLPEEETARLVTALLETSVIPPELTRPILDRAGGNPLFAEEYLRLLKDKNLLVKKGASWKLQEGAEIPLPNSVQALISARLDTLSSDVKSMLADAAVVGNVFWSGAVAAIGQRDVDKVAEALRELSRMELVRPVRRSSIGDEAEYAFWHILARDVAYSQLPRASRASRHVATASWIESKTSERVEDLADVLAYHYATALELARATGESQSATDLEAPALRFLTLAGDRAVGLDTAAALRSFERALALTPPGHPERPEVLTRFGQAAFQAGRLIEASEALDEAIASFRARGDRAAAVRAMASIALREIGDPRWSKFPAEAVDLLEPLPPGPELVVALTEAAAVETMTGGPEAGVRAAERALALAEDLGLARSARAVGFRGLARSFLGDPRGLEDQREAITLATQAGQGIEVALVHNNLGVGLWAFEGPTAALEVMRAGIAFAQARGLAAIVDFSTASTLDLLVDAGECQEAIEVGAGLAERLETGVDVLVLVCIRAAQARILALRGQAAQAAGSLDWLESSARGVGSEILVIGLCSAAFAHAGLSQDKSAASLLAEVAATPGARGVVVYAAYLPAMVRTALGIGDRSLAERLVTDVQPRYRYAEHSLVAANAALTESHEDLEVAAEGYADAADRWERFGVVPEQAFALLGQGRCLVGLSRPAEAAPVLQHAREIFERLRATPGLAETEALLAAVA